MNRIINRSLNWSIFSGWHSIFQFLDKLDSEFCGWISFQRILNEPTGDFKLHLKQNHKCRNGIEKIMNVFTISQDPLIMPQKRLQYLRLRQLSGNSTNSVIGFWSNKRENSSLAEDQLVTVGFTPRYILKALWIFSAVSLMSVHLAVDVRARKSSIILTPILYPILSSCRFTSSAFS